MRSKATRGCDQPSSFKQRNVTWSWDKRQNRCGGVGRALPRALTRHGRGRCQGGLGLSGVPGGAFPSKARRAAAPKGRSSHPASLAQCRGGWSFLSSGQRHGGSWRAGAAGVPFEPASASLCTHAQHSTVDSCHCRKAAAWAGVQSSGLSSLPVSNSSSATLSWAT